ncbi:3-dehydroquinate synthase [Enterococcus sp. BWM-S5]|uniref:3-dehydroquinate synthase n=2 Tax=Enterococcus larvae TaxID=2794352 RepID=A0ABS4CGE7_9ENTE|nr:3-dehydroquinate synthase [Enterococcus larvae]
MTLGVSLRSIALEELPKLQEIYQKAFTDILEKYKDSGSNPASVTMEQLYRIYQSSTHSLYFILSDGEIAGSIRLSHLSKETIKLGPIAVSPVYQKRGIGKTALELIEAEYPACRNWLLDTIEQEEYLVDFYKSIGYVPTGRTEAVQPNMTIIFFKKEVSEMLTVQLPTHEYQIIIEKNSLTEIGKWAAKLWKPQKVAIVTDTTVDELYGSLVLNQLTANGFETTKIVVPAGETSKSLENTEKIYEHLAENQFTRSDGILALGGGVIGDLAGFAAATYMRGIHFLQVPTTLLAQVDSSIGGKTGVNTKNAKNLVGAFWQPDGVLIDPNTLNTLEPRRLKEGIAEIVKSAAIADKELWEKLENLKDEQDLLAHAPEIITACLKIKRAVVQEDELDNGIRLILNFGHTIGHAIENTAGYGVVSHGEAVAIGMVQINRIAEQKGLTPEDTTEQLITMLKKFGLPISYDNWNEETLYQALTHDKKTRGTAIKIILLEEIGKAKIVPTEIEEMKEYLKRS